MQKLTSNQNQNHLLENDLKTKSQFKNLISNRTQHKIKRSENITYMSKTTRLITTLTVALFS